MRNLSKADENFLVQEMDSITKTGRDAVTIVAIASLLDLPADVVASKFRDVMVMRNKLFATRGPIDV